MDDETFPSTNIPTTTKRRVTKQVYPQNWNNINSGTQIAPQPHNHSHSHGATGAGAPAGYTNYIISGAGGGVGIGPGTTNTFINNDTAHLAWNAMSNLLEKEQAKNILSLINRAGKNNYKTSFAIEQACVLASQERDVVLIVRTNAIATTVKRELSNQLDQDMVKRIRVLGIENINNLMGLRYDTIVADPDVYIHLLTQLVK